MTDPSLNLESPNIPPEKKPGWEAIRSAKRIGSQIRTWIQTSRVFKPREWSARGALWKTAVVLVMLFLAAVERDGITHMRENQTGVLVNNLTGRLTWKERVGYHLYLPYLFNFYVLDKTIHKLELSWAQGPAGIRRDVKLKTSDGSDVSLDVTVNYKLIPSSAVDVLQKSGAESRFSEVWMEPFTRQVCLEIFGELTTEEMYDATQRNAKAALTQERLDGLLRPQGIEIIAVIPGEFRFYKEYEDVIQQKKLADQQVEEQQALARAALQDQQRQIVEEQKKAEVRLTTAEGECANRLIQSQAEAEKLKRVSDQYYETTLLAADALLYSASSEAQGIQASLQAEAEGMEQLRQAMTGDGGLRMVGMEYAKRLQSTRFSGTPVIRDAQIKQYSVQPGGSPAGDPRSLLPALIPAAPAPGGEK